MALRGGKQASGLKEVLRTNESAFTSAGGAALDLALEGVACCRHAGLHALRSLTHVLDSLAVVNGCAGGVPSDVSIRDWGDPDGFPLLRILPWFRRAR